MVYRLGILLISLAAIKFDASAMSVIIDASLTEANPKRIIPSFAPSINPSEYDVRSIIPARRIWSQQFRIRRARIADLDAVSTMLAMESVPSDHKHNWNDDMKRLRAKSELRRQLFHRLAALEAGRETASRLKEQYTLTDDYDYLRSLSDDYDACHQLWRHDNFRSKVQTAVAHSQENNAWRFHNFDLAPRMELLNHVMTSVVDLSSGEVVGFCEVALLPCPTIDTSRVVHDGTHSTRQLQIAQYIDRGMQDDVPGIAFAPHMNHGETTRSYSEHNSRHDKEVGSITFTPAIVNLVTSPSHRRMGIASRLLKFASKFTTTYWRSSRHDKGSTGLGLYVHPENESALRLYAKVGFSLISSDVVDGFMYKRLRK